VHLGIVVVSGDGVGTVRIGVEAVASRVQGVVGKFWGVSL